MNENRLPDYIEHIQQAATDACSFVEGLVKDDIARIKGVGDVTFLGPRDYSMRIWLDRDRLSSLQMTPSDVISAIQQQNIQVASGRVGQPPS